MIGREHHAAGRADHVEAADGQFQAFAVADPVVDREAEPRRARGRGLDEHGGEVDPGHVGSPRRCALGDRAGAAGKIEPTQARPRVEPLDDELVDVRDRLGDSLIVPASPHGALPALLCGVGHVDLLISLTTGMRRCRLTGHGPDSITMNLPAESRLPSIPVNDSDVHIDGGDAEARERGVQASGDRVSGPVGRRT